MSQAIALPPTPLTPAAFPRDETPTPTPNTRCARARALCADNAGLLLIAAAQLFMTLMNLSVKILTGLPTPVPTLELVLVRMVITYCCAVSYMIIRKIPHPILGPPDVRALLLFRGFSGFVSIFGIYFSLQTLSLSDSVVLTFLAPSTTALAGRLFLHEALAPREVVAGLLSLVGVVLIARPPALFGAPALDTDTPTNPAPAHARLVAVGIALLGVAGATGAYTSLRAIGTRAHPLHSLAAFAACAALIALPAMLALRVSPVVPHDHRTAALLLAFGACGFVGQILLALGLQRETASRGALALYTQLLFAAALERAVLGTAPAALSLLGMGVIGACGVYVVLTKERAPAGYARVDDVEGVELVVQK